MGPGVRSEKFKKSERVFSWKKVLWGTVLPFAIMGWITTNALLWQQYTSRYRTGTGLDVIGNSVNYGVEGTRLENEAGVRIILLVTSSWTARSTINRQAFRQSTLKTFPPSSGQLSIRYKFLLGTAPSPQAQAKLATSLAVEEAEFGDLLFLPASDRYEQLSEKIWWGWRWAAKQRADYVLKTDDDVFLRMEIISKELKELGRRDDYWRGFAYW